MAVPPPPRVVELLLSPTGDRALRFVQRLRQRRILGHAGPVVFIDPQDPHAVLLLVMLEQLGVTDWPVVLVRTQGLADPERARRWALADARELAVQLSLPVSLGEVPADAAAARFAAALPDPCDVGQALPALRRLWTGETLAGDPETGRRRLERGKRLLGRLGHYLGALVLSGGEWYWGVDRLGYLYPEIWRRFPGTDAPVADDGERIELFFSFRSPYSWIALDRLRREPAFSRIDLGVRPVLPMVLRGFEVPAAKRLYIVRDAAREARRHGVPFGRICDPVPTGGVQAAMARVPAAIERDVLPRYCHAVARAIWAEGRDVSRKDVLDRVLRDARLPRLEPVDAPQWQPVAQQNRDALTALGLWGVPVLRWKRFAAWGQDRLGILAARMAAGNDAPLGAGDDVD